MSVVSFDPPTYMLNARLKFLAWQVTKEEEPLDWVRDLEKAGMLKWGLSADGTINYVSVLRRRQDMGDEETLHRAYGSAEARILDRMHRSSVSDGDWLVLIDGTICGIGAEDFAFTVISTRERMRNTYR